MIVFLDDNEERQKKFRRNAIGFSAKQARTAREALAFLRELDKVDLIMLDHDLNAETNNQLIEEEEDGRWVSKRMVEEQLHVGTTVVIHSANPVGSNEMEAILRDGGYENVYQISEAWNKLSKTPDGRIKIDDTLPDTLDLLDYM